MSKGEWQPDRRARRDAYLAKLRDPRWQKMRLRVLERDGWACQNCSMNEETLHVHHRWYCKGDPWDVPMEALQTLCEWCHQAETEQRPVAEADLLRALKRRFGWGDVKELAVAIDALADRELPAAPVIVMAAVSKIIKDEGRLQSAVDEFWAEADRMRKEWDAKPLEEKAHAFRDHGDSGV